MACFDIYGVSKQVPVSQRICLVSTNCILLFTSFILNLFLLFTLLKAKVVKTFSFRLLFLLNTADLLSALIMQPLWTILIWKKENFCRLQLITLFVTMFISYVNGLCIFMISADRYCHLYYSVRYKLILTKTRERFANISIPVISTVIAATYVMSVLLGKWYYLILDLVISSSSIIAFVILLVIYWRCCQKIRQHSKIRARLRENEQKRASRTKFDSKSTLTVLLIVMSMVICYWPFMCIKLVLTLKCFHSYATLELVVTLQWLRLLGFIHTIIDVAILFCRNSQIRRTVVTVCLRQSDDISFSAAGEQTIQTGKINYHPGLWNIYWP